MTTSFSRDDRGLEQLTFKVADGNVCWQLVVRSRANTSRPTCAGHTRSRSVPKPSRLVIVHGNDRFLRTMPVDSARIGSWPSHSIQKIRSNLGSPNEAISTFTLSTRLSSIADQAGLAVDIGPGHGVGPQTHGTAILRARCFSWSDAVDRGDRHF